MGRVNEMERKERERGNRMVVYMAEERQRQRQRRPGLEFDGQVLNRNVINPNTTKQKIKVDGSNGVGRGIS